MSYEGREFFLCENGHLTVTDWWQSGINLGDKCHCAAPLQYQASVDDTNGDGIEPDCILIRHAQTCRCHCGNCHIAVEALYRPADRTKWNTIYSATEE